MKMLYDMFYKRYGIYKTQQLLRPRVFTEDVFDFPKNSVLHYVGSAEKPFPEEMLPFIKDDLRYNIDHIYYLKFTEGHPRRSSRQPIGLIRHFHSKNKNFKWVKTPVRVNTNPNTLDVISYGLLWGGYIYSDTPINAYHAWRNVHETVWDSIQFETKDIEKNHFVFIDVPETLVGIPNLRNYVDKVNFSQMRIFDTDGRKYILEFWKWLNLDTRNLSLMSKIRKEDLRRVNVVFKFKDSWSVVNLNVLDTIFNEEQDNGLKLSHLNSETLQKYFLRYLMSIQSFETEDVIDENFDDDGVLIKDDVRSEEVSEDLDILNKLDQGYTKKREMMTSTLSSVAKTKTNAAVSDDDEGTESFSPKDETNDVKGDESDDVSPEEDVGTDIQLSQEEHDLFFKQSNLPEDEFVKSLEVALDGGLMTGSEYKYLLKSLADYKKLDDPYGSKRPLHTLNRVEPTRLVLSEEKATYPVTSGLLDESQSRTSLNVFDKDYIENVMRDDIISMPLALQRAGVIIQDYEVEEEASILGEFDVHTLRVKPIDGAPSMIRFRLPKVQSDGSFMISGNTYQMGKQRADVPIRKVDESTVALTTYYGKLFVRRSEKRVSDAIGWLSRQVLAKGLDNEDKTIENIVPGCVFDNNVKVPRLYSGMAMAMSGFETKDYIFDFTQPQIKAGNDLTFVGHDKVRKVKIYLDERSNILIEQGKSTFVIVDDFFNVTGLDKQRLPVDYVTVSVFSKDIPLILPLGYINGIDHVLKILKYKPKFYKRRSRFDLQPDEFAISFADVVMVVSREHEQASLILAGFLPYKKIISGLSYSDFNRKDAYFVITESLKLNSIYLKEIELLDQLFVDPITEVLLTEIKEPTTYKGLLVRSAELLTDDMHPDLTDMRYMRIKGYERFSGITYKVLVQALREYRMSGIRGKSSVTMSPFSVWQAVTTDPSIMLKQEINPLDDLKQKERVTYSGEGGRSKEAMSPDTRIFHPHDVGVISESSSDSADVGVTTYLTTDPNFNSLRGTIKKAELTDIRPAQLASTSMMLSAGAQQDDVKRVGFISIQQSHTIATVSYTQPLVRTGVEEVISKRVTSKFASTAEQDGQVISLDARGMIVEYSDGKRLGIYLGRRYGYAEGHAYPHDIRTALNIKDTFKRGDTLAYNSGFFEPDFFDPRKIIFKSSLLAKTVFYESQQTLEDSSAISSKLASRLSAPVTERRSIVIDFKDGVLNIVTPGQRVKPNDFLMFIEDEISNERGLFNEASIELLKKLSNKAPRAKINGSIDRIEVFYNGDKEDMSPSLRKIVDQSDRQFTLEAKSTLNKPFVGEVDDSYSVGGNRLVFGQAEIRIFITQINGTGVGDKIVVGHQLKSVIGEQLESTMTTEKGEEVDLVFGERSKLARITNSADILGTTNTLLLLIGKKAVDIYKKR